MTTTQLSHSRFLTDKVTEEAIEAIKKEVSVFVETEAKIAGGRKLPASLAAYVVTVIKPIVAMVQKGVDLNYTRNQPISNLSVIQAKRVKAKEDIIKKDVEIADKTRAVTSITADLEKQAATLPPTPNTLINKTVPGTLAGTEALLSGMTMMSAGLPILAVVIVCVGIALASGIGVSIGASYIANADTPKKRKLRYATVIAIGVFVSCCIGAWRASLDQAVASTNASLADTIQDTPAFSSLIFTVISALLFVIALAFKVKHHVSKTDKKKLDDYAAKKQGLAKAKKELADLEAEKEVIDATMREHSAEAVHQLEYAKSVEERLVNIVEFGKATYESVNVAHRPDGHCPEFFSMDIPLGLKLSFTTYLNTTNKQS